MGFQIAKNAVNMSLLFMLTVESVHVCKGKSFSVRPTLSDYLIDDLHFSC